ncbi:MAG: ORF6N domain-containing protein [Spirochaetes bacterium]|nr:ORF6N domain-containing protein [Spirochaetota bacterium]
MDKDIIEQSDIASKIYIIRCKKIMLDLDLALLYGVQTKRLKEQVRRNLKRFPIDFMFEITKDEYSSLRSQIATLKDGRGRHSKYLPMAFTEQGIAMLSSVLNSDKAIQVNIQIMRTFTKLRELILSNKGLKKKIDELEKKYDKQFQIVFEAIRQLLEPPKPGKKYKIGF